jgi:hypothetical protein
MSLGVPVSSATTDAHSTTQRTAVEARETRVPYGSFSARDEPRVKLGASRGRRKRRAAGPRNRVVRVEIPEHPRERIVGIARARRRAS